MNKEELKNKLNSVKSNVKNIWNKNTRSKDVEIIKHDKKKAGRQSAG